MTEPRRVRGYAALLGAIAVSSTGTRMSVIAVPWFVLATTGSPALTGVAVFVEIGALVLARLLGGPVIDRVGARRASVVGDTLAGVALALVPLLHLADRLGFGTLLVLVGIAGLCRGPGDSAKYVLLPDLAEQAALSNERAVGLSDGVNRVGMLIGAPLGGALVALAGAPLVIAVDAVTFVVSAGLVAGLVRTPAQAGQAPGGVRAYATELREGFGFVRRESFLMAAVTMIFVTNLLDQALSGVLYPVWAQQRYGSAVVLGVIGGAFGLGAVVGTLVVARYGERLPRRRTYAWAFLLGAVPRIFSLVLPVGVPVLVAVFLLGGFFVGAINPMLSAAEYERIPAHLRARVLGAVGGLAWAGMPLGGLLGGWLAEAVDIDVALVAVGAAYLLVTLDPFVRPAWRGMDRVTDRPSAGGARNVQETSGGETDAEAAMER